MKLTSKLIATAIFAFSTLAFSASAKANNTDSTLKATVAVEEVAPATLQFIGSLEDQPVFRLNLDNAKEYTIVVKGSFGEVLYKDVISSNISNKKFLLTREAFNDSRARFEVTAKGSSKTMYFDVDLYSDDADKMIVSSVK